MEQAEMLIAAGKTDDALHQLGAVEEWHKGQITLCKQSWPDGWQPFSAQLRWIEFELKRSELLAMYDEDAVQETVAQLNDNALKFHDELKSFSLEYAPQQEEMLQRTVQVLISTNEILKQTEEVAKWKTRLQPD